MLAEHMTWEEYRDEVGRKIIILPVGSLEQHGPHLPLNVDTLIAVGLAELVAERLSAVVLPPVSYGAKSHSGGGELFPGTTSLDGTTLINLVLDVLRETYRHGGRRFLILNAHFENVAFLVEAAELLLRVGDDARVVVLSWWDLVSDEVIEDLFAEVGFPGWEIEHAAIAETSLVQYLAPDLVREDRIIDDRIKREIPYLVLPPPDDTMTRSGVLYRATYASREKGERLACYAVEKIVEVARRELGAG